MKQICEIPFAASGAVANMALDATMLQFGRDTEQAIWRMYGWTEPAMTFGYSQRWQDVRRSLSDFSGILIRRLTGGGIVDHQHDLTYALTIPGSHSFHRQPATDLYRQLHEQISGILMKAGIAADLAPCQRGCDDTPKEHSGSFCFQAAEPYDVVDPLSGIKLAGAAMKRNRLGVLIQGSLNHAAMAGLDGKEFSNAFGQAVANWLGLQPVPLTGTLPAPILTEELVRFGSSEWNERR